MHVCFRYQDAHDQICIIEGNLEVQDPTDGQTQHQVWIRPNGFWIRGSTIDAGFKNQSIIN